MIKKSEQPRLKAKYDKEIIPAMMKDFGLKNRLSVPAIEKISINIGVGKMAVKDSKMVDQVVNGTAKIIGQKPVITKSKKSVAGFKLRQGAPVGVMATLRGPRMYEFLDRLVNIALPRVRDFRGLDPKSFDEQGNFSIGIREHTVFPEITLESSEQIYGMQVNIHLNRKSKDMGVALLKYFGFPFRGAKE